MSAVVEEREDRAAPSRRLRNKAAVGDRILTAAREAFVAHGVNDSDLSDIARKAGVGRATLYRYFDGKDALTRAIIEQDREREVRLFERLVREPVDAERIETWLNLLLKAATASAASFPIYFSLGEETLRGEGLQMLRDRLLDILAQRFPRMARGADGAPGRDRTEALLLLMSLEQFTAHVASGAEPEETALGVEILRDRLMTFLEPRPRRRAKRADRA